MCGEVNQHKSFASGQTGELENLHHQPNTVYCANLAVREQEALKVLVGGLFFFYLGTKSV